MSRLSELLVQAKDAQMGADLEREFKVLSARLPFGLNFERHRPEAVELPGRQVRKGDTVRLGVWEMKQEGLIAPTGRDRGAKWAKRRTP